MRMPPRTPPPVTPSSEVSPGSKTVSELPLSPPFATITMARNSMGMKEHAANVSMARSASRTPR